MNWLIIMTELRLTHINIIKRHKHSE